MIKRFIITLAIFASATACSSIANNINDQEIYNIIKLYKSQNYVGCIEEATKITESNPSNIFAYYYKGLAYSQLGKKSEAMSAFDQVISINTNSTLVEYSQKANACIQDPSNCEKYEREVGELEAFIKSDKFLSNPVQSQVNQKKLDRIRENINDDVKNKKKSDIPTNDEIANAVKTLAKAGLNPFAGMNAGYSNPQMMQMSMLLNDNNGYGYNYNNMNMLPVLLMNQNSEQQLPTDLIQTMMMNQMSPAL